MRRSVTIVVVAMAMVLSGALAAVAGGGSGGWSPAESIEDFGAGAHENFNTPSNDGCLRCHWMGGRCTSDPTGPLERQQPMST